MITTANYNRLYREIKKYKNLRRLRDRHGARLCKKYGITGGQLNFAVCVVAAEVMKENGLDKLFI